jgi:glycosyltransferase involved in cell wall biosynthesis
MGQFMRVGQNPAKSIRHVAQPEKVTVAVTAYIPFLGGYYAHSLEVLKVCLGSILANTDQPFDLMVFDNASCPEVVGFLETLRDQGKIQFLILSGKNVGKVGAWNAIFGAAPGEYIAYSDMDVYYYPGWLSKHLEVFEAFPEAGTVAGLPRRGDLPLYTNTIRQLASLNDTMVEQGRLIPDEWILDHAHSLGKTQESIADEFDLNDYRISGKAYRVCYWYPLPIYGSSGCGQKILPFPNERPMGNSVAHFDQAVDGNHLPAGDI